MNLFTKQECISVGCVPSTTVTVCWRGGLHHSPGSRHPPRAGTPGAGTPSRSRYLPPRAGTQPQSRHQPHGSRHPPCQIPLNFPQWLWAWTRSPSTSPLVVGLDQIPLNFPLGCVPGPDPPQLPPWLWAWRPPWPDPPKLPPWVWVWKPARHAGIPPPQDLLQGMLGCHLLWTDRHL